MRFKMTIIDKIYILLVPIILMFVLFVLINHESYLTNNFGLFIYVALPVSCVIGIVLAFFLPRSVRNVIFLFGIVLVATLYSFETWYWFDETRDRLPPDADRRSLSEVISEFRRTGVAAHRSYSSQMISRISPGALRGATGQPFLPLGSIANAITVHCNESGNWRTYKSDKYGFPNPRGAWDWRQTDILAVGDSYTHGACVPDGKEFVGLIRNVFPRTINLGTGGNGPLAELASLREYAALRRPKLVFWFYYENDLQKDLFREKEHSILMGYLKPGFKQNLAVMQDEIDTALMDLAKAGRQVDSKDGSAEQKATSSSILRYVRFDEFGSVFTHLPGLTLMRTRIRLGLVGGGGEWPEPETDLFRQILTTAKQEVESWKGQLVIVILPSWERIIRGLKTKDRHLNAARTIFADLGLAVVDIVPIMRDHPDPRALWPNRGSGHYSETGHRLVADTVIQWLKRPELKSK